MSSESTDNRQTNERVRLFNTGYALIKIPVVDGEFLQLEFEKFLLSFKWDKPPLIPANISNHGSRTASMYPSCAYTPPDLNVAGNIEDCRIAWKTPEGHYDTVEKVTVWITPRSYISQGQKSSLEDVHSEVLKVHRDIKEINKNTDAIAKNNFQVRQENEELKKLYAEGHLKFASRIAAEDFQAFASIMIVGNRKGAAELLKKPLRTFYDRVDKWATMGSEYKQMFRLIKWRKKVTGKDTVPLGDSLLSGANGKPENPETVKAVLNRIRENESDKNYPELLQEILNTLAQQNSDNWDKVKKELVDLISEEVPQ